MWAVWLRWRSFPFAQVHCGEVTAFGTSILVRSFWEIEYIQGSQWRSQEFFPRGGRFNPETFPLLMSLIEYKLSYVIVFDNSLELPPSFIIIPSSPPIRKFDR